MKVGARASVFRACHARRRENGVGCLFSVHLRFFQVDGASTADREEASYSVVRRQELADRIGDAACLVVGEFGVDRQGKPGRVGIAHQFIVMLGRCRVGGRCPPYALRTRPTEARVHPSSGHATPVGGGTKYGASSLVHPCFFQVDGALTANREEAFYSVVGRQELARAPLVVKETTARLAEKRPITRPAASGCRVGRRWSARWCP